MSESNNIAGLLGQYRFVKNLPIDFKVIMEYIRSGRRVYFCRFKNHQRIKLRIKTPNDIDRVFNLPIKSSRDYHDISQGWWQIE